MKDNKITFSTDNDINVAVIKNGQDLLINEDCCTCINILLKNDGQILTSFMGSHNPYIVSQLEKAQRAYFKALKKALKADFKNPDSACHCHDHECNCNHDHECHCHDDGHECHCHDEKHDCGCGDGCTCGDDCHCTPDNKCNDNCTCGENKQNTKPKTTTKKPSTKANKTK